MAENIFSSVPVAGRFARVECEIVYDMRLSMCGKCVYQAIAVEVWGSKPKYPSITEIAQRVRCSRASVIKAERELIKLGYLIKESSKIPCKNGWDVNKYRLPLHERDEAAAKLPASIPRDPVEIQRERALADLKKMRAAEAAVS